MADNIIERPKLVPKMLGNPKKVTGMDADNARHYVGTIYGVASGVKSKVDAKGDAFEAIVGDFGGIPGDEIKIDDVPVTEFRSGVLYLPGGIHERLAVPLKREGAGQIKFAIELYTIKAANPIGYSWEVKAALPPAENDMLADMRKELTGKTKALPAPTANAHKEKEKAK